MNHDIVAPGMGFGTHPHDNMEIITIPLHGALQHKDSMGNSSVIHAGEIQVMSAGSGIQHSEFNPDPNAPTELLQIWVFPDKGNVEPRYQQLAYDINQPGIQTLLTDQPADTSVWIHQRAKFSLVNLGSGEQINYSVMHPQNGVYAFVLAGKWTIEEQVLELNDALGIWETDTINIKAEDTPCRLLLLDIPMGV